MVEESADVPFLVTDAMDDAKELADDLKNSTFKDSAKKDSYTELFKKYNSFKTQFRMEI